MSSPQADEITLDSSAAELLQMAALAAGIVLRGEVVGFVLHDGERVAIVPKPGLETQIIGVLGQADWAAQLRMAEELTR